MAVEILLNHGLIKQLIEEGKTEDIFTNPRNKQTQDYIMGRIG